MNPLLRFYRRITNWRWEIGFLDNTLDSVVKGDPLKVHWLNLPFRDRWFADPFILDYNKEEIILLCEEYSDELKRGRIAKVVVDRNSYELKSWKIVLDEATHLSFPRVIRKDGDIFIHPENCESGTHSIYHYNKKNDSLECAKVICDEPLTDAVMLETKGHHLIFSTQLPDANGNLLSVYEKTNNKYLHKSDILFDNRCARMAGDFFMIDGTLYRPAQDCNGDYGRAVIIQKVVSENDNWIFKDVRHIDSPHPILTWGLHTFNHYNGMIVIDVKGPRYPLMSKLFMTISSLIKRLFRCAK